MPANQADLTAFASLAACPAVSIPMGTLPNGMPIGMQLIGRPLAEETLLLASQAFEDHYGTAFAPVAAA